MIAVYQNPGIFIAKKIASTTGNTCGDLQCVKWHHNDPEGASRPFKVLTLIRVKMINRMPLYVGPYGGD